MYHVFCRIKGPRSKKSLFSADISAGCGGKTEFSSEYRLIFFKKPVIVEAVVPFSTQKQQGEKP